MTYYFKDLVDANLDDLFEELVSIEMAEKGLDEDTFDREKYIDSFSIEEKAMYVIAHTHRK